MSFVVRCKTCEEVVEAGGDLVQETDRGCRFCQLQAERDALKRAHNGEICVDVQEYCEKLEAERDALALKVSDAEWYIDRRTQFVAPAHQTFWQALRAARKNEEGGG